VADLGFGKFKTILLSSSFPQRWVQGGQKFLQGLYEVYSLVLDH